jgi:hypothetical protein
MHSLQELPEWTRRRLELQRQDLLDICGFSTGEQFRWYEWEMERLARIAAQGGDSHRSWPLERKRATDTRGIQNSVRFAEKRFKALVREYERLWLDRLREGAGCEIYFDWLRQLKAIVFNETAAVWKSDSEAIRRRFEEDYGPAIEKALADLVASESKWARGIEIEWIMASESSIASENFTCIDPVVSQPGRIGTDTCQQRPAAQVSDARRDTIDQPIQPSNEASEPSSHIPAKRMDWEQIEISFLSEERVQIQTGSESRTLNYAEMGFEDQRNGKPNKAWRAFVALAQDRGMIRSGSRPGSRWAIAEKRVQELRRALKNWFPISTDPIPFVRGIGYQARFRIGCSPSFDT